MSQTRNKIIEDILSCFQTIRRRLSANSQFMSKHTGATPAQMTTLLAIKHHPNMTVRELSAHFGISKSAITKIVDELLARNLVTREPDPEDRRSVSINLSDDGRSQFTKMKNQINAKLATIFAALSDDELEQLRGIFNKIKESS